MLELCDTYFKAVMTKMLQYTIMNALETCRNRNTQRRNRRHGDETSGK